jgi:outer membrane immunogenic protein
MKKIALAAAAVSILMVGVASAADMAPRYAKAPPPVTPVWSWTGFYIGGDLGGAWIQKDDAVLTLPPGPPQAFLPFLANGSIPVNYGTRGSSFLYGAHAGYNWQVSNFVLGAEADIFGSSSRFTQNQTTNVPAALASFGLIYSTKIDYIGTVRGRAGLLVTPNVLLYATGGFAYGRVNHTYSESFGPLGGNPFTTNQSFGSSTNTNTGWVAGAGAEWMIAQNWSLRAEYLYVNLSGSSFTTPSNNPNCGLVNACSFTLTPSNLGLNIARVGLSYKFGGPVVARY